MPINLVLLKFWTKNVIWWRNGFNLDEALGYHGFEFLIPSVFIGEVYNVTISLKYFDWGALLRTVYIFYTYLPAHVIRGVNNSIWDTHILGGLINSILDLQSRFSVNLMCVERWSQSWRGQRSSIDERPLTKWFLKVWMASSTAMTW